MFLNVWRGLGGGGRLERVRGAYAHQIVLFKENSILLLPESLESSEWQLLKVKVSKKV